MLACMILQSSETRSDSFKSNKKEHYPLFERGWVIMIKNGFNEHLFSNSILGLNSSDARTVKFDKLTFYSMWINVIEPNFFS